MRLTMCMRACYSCIWRGREKISRVRGAGGIVSGAGRHKPSLCARAKSASRCSVSRKGACAELAVSPRVGMGEGKEGIITNVVGGGVASGPTLVSSSFVEADVAVGLSGRWHAKASMPEHAESCYSDQASHPRATHFFTPATTRLSVLPPSPYRQPAAQDLDLIWWRSLVEARPAPRQRPAVTSYPGLEAPLWPRHEPLFATNVECNPALANHGIAIY